MKKRLSQFLSQVVDPNLPEEAQSRVFEVRNTGGSTQALNTGCTNYGSCNLSNNSACTNHGCSGAGNNTNCINKPLPPGTIC